MHIRRLFVIGFGITPLLLIQFPLALSKSLRAPDEESIVDVKKAALEHHPFLYQLRLSSFLFPGHEGDNIGKPAEENLQAVKQLHPENEIATFIDEKQTPINRVASTLAEEAAVHKSLQRHLADVKHVQSPVASYVTTYNKFSESMVTKPFTKATQVFKESDAKNNRLHSPHQSFQTGDSMSSSNIKEISDKSDQADGKRRFFDDDSLPYYYYDDYFPTQAPRSDDIQDDNYPTPDPQSDDYYPTPGPESDDYQDDYFTTPAPLPVPSLQPSYSPTSPNPTSSFVKDFSLAGQGFCYDQSYEYYPFIQSHYLPAHTNDTYCLDWCSQNPHPYLVGVEIYRSPNAVNCRCSFSGRASNIIHENDYSPSAWGVYNGYSGVGAIVMADGDSNAKCYRYENYKQSYPASTIKIELGTGENINLFEVQVYSAGIDVATKKPSSQSSTLNSYGASLAVDGKNTTFSHTNVAASSGPVWWKVDLGDEFHVESVTILNRWCGSSSDPSGCLCRLSFATLFLIDSKGAVVATQSFGDTCGKKQVSLDRFLVQTSFGDF